MLKHGIFIIYEFETLAYWPYTRKGILWAVNLYQKSIHEYIVPIMGVSKFLWEQYCDLCWWTYPWRKLGDLTIKCKQIWVMREEVCQDIQMHLFLAIFGKHIYRNNLLCEVCRKQKNRVRHKLFQAPTLRIEALDWPLRFKPSFFLLRGHVNRE